MTEADPLTALVDAVTRLHEQVETGQRRTDELISEVRSRADDPLIRDLVTLVDTCVRTARSWAGRDSAEPADVGAAFTGVADDLTGALARAGVEPFSPEPGSPFDRRSAQVVRVEQTDDPAASGRIASVLRTGYRSGDRVLRYADVVVFRA